MWKRVWHVYTRCCYLMSFVIYLTFSCFSHPFIEIAVVVLQANTYHSELLKVARMKLCGNAVQRCCNGSSHLCRSQWVVCIHSIPCLCSELDVAAVSPAFCLVARWCCLPLIAWFNVVIGCTAHYENMKGDTKYGKWGGLVQLGVNQDQWKYRYSIDHIWVPISVQ